MKGVSDLLRVLSTFDAQSLPRKMFIYPDSSGKSYVITLGGAEAATILLEGKNAPELPKKVRDHFIRDIQLFLVSLREDYIKDAPEKCVVISSVVRGLFNWRYG